MNPRLTLLALGLVAFAASAFAQPKIAVVDVQKVFEEYYKTKAANAQLQDSAADLTKEGNAYMDQYKKMGEDYKKLLEEASNQAVSTEEREKRKKLAESKLVEIKELEATVRQFEKTAATTISERKRQMRDKLLAEIRSVINTRVKAAGYSLVLDVSAESINQTPIVIYQSGENDLTAAVLEQLNANAPPTLKSDDPKPSDKKKGK